MSALIARIKVSKVKSVFRVSEKTAPREASEFVILFEDHSYFCTCALLQNMGIVCRHFFWMMQESGDFRYHIRLIPKRWFEEEMQENKQIDDKIAKETYKFAGTKKVWSSITNDQPSNEYMGNMQEFYPPQPVIPPNKRKKVTKSRFAKVTGAASELAEIISSPTVHEDVFNSVFDTIKAARLVAKDGLPKTKNKRTEAIKVQGLLQGDNKASSDLFDGIPLEEFSDGDIVPPKGRPTGKRVRGSFEPKRSWFKKQRAK